MAASMLATIVDCHDICERSTNIDPDPVRRRAQSLTPKSALARKQWLGCKTRAQDSIHWVAQSTIATGYKNPCRIGMYEMSVART
jgi:hypothetical protein